MLTLPTHAELTAATREVYAEQGYGGLLNHMWAGICDPDGIVTALAMSGDNRRAQWRGSHAIAPEKANTATLFSLSPVKDVAGSGLSLGTAALYSLVQPGGSLWGLERSNPANQAVLFSGGHDKWGTPDDPFTNKEIGGIIPFGGGLTLHNESGEIIGGLGVSGDTSLSDHIFAWLLREKLGLNYVPHGVSTHDGTAFHNDNILLDGKIVNGLFVSDSGFAHPAVDWKQAVEIATSLPVQHPNRAILVQ